jgi:hypothetical protein
MRQAEQHSYPNSVSIGLFNAEDGSSSFWYTFTRLYGATTQKTTSELALP